MSTGELAHLTQEERAAWGREMLRRAGWAVSSPPRPSTPASPAGLDSPESIAYLLADLRSTSEGQKLGESFFHNPYRFAASLGVGIECVPIGQLQNADRPKIEIRGRLWRLPGQRPFVQLADTLREPEASRVLAHELGHFLDFPSEKLCDQFADAFLKVDDREVRDVQWYQQRRGLLARARACGKTVV